jgi:hypothetical protein
MADSTMQTNTIDRPASPESEQPRRPAELSEGGASGIQQEAQTTPAGRHATPGRRPLFRR